MHTFNRFTFIKLTPQKKGILSCERRLADTAISPDISLATHFPHQIYFFAKIIFLLSLNPTCYNLTDEHLFFCSHKYMKILRISLIAIVSLVLLGVASFYVDYYYYSWTSFVKPFGCEYKYIGPVKVPLEQQSYDSTQIGEKSKLNSSYESVYYDVSRVSVASVFNNVRYVIRIESYNTSVGKLTEASFYNDSDNKNDSKTTSDYYIIQNINQMIDEMPLTVAQKAELKSKVTVRCSSGIRFP
jgi:hypothetical protein